MVPKISTFRTTAISAAAMVVLLLSAATAFAQTAQTAPADAGASASKPPAYVPQGAPPPANDPVPAPTSPVRSAETAQAEAPTTPTDTVTAPGSATPRNWTTDQILTATVHQAWILAGKDEKNFFEIVKELAAISAENRELTLPDTPAAGRKAGDYIKTQAKADHDQLLYDIVDKAVRMTGVKEAGAVAAAPAPPASHPGK